MSKIPRHPDETTLLQEIKDLKKRIQALEGQTRAESTSIGRGGMKIKEGGDLKVVDRNGEVIGWIGYIGNYATPQGDPQPGMAWYRNDDSGNTLALSLLDWNSTDADGYHQVLRFWDRSGHVLFEDNPDGLGLNAPNFVHDTCIASRNGAYHMFGSTLNTSTEGVGDLAESRGHLLSPRFQAQVECRSHEDASYGGLYSVEVSYWAGDNSGNWVWVTEEVWTRTETAGHWFLADINFTPPPNANFGERITFRLKGRRYGTAGAGRAVYGRFKFVSGHGANYSG